MLRFLIRSVMVGLWLGGLTTTAIAQGLPAGDYDKMPFSEFVATIEAQGTYRFYYNPSWIEALRVVQPTDSRQLAVLLEATTAGTSLAFWINDAQQVFLWPGQPLKLNLPPPSIRPTTSLSPGQRTTEIEALAHLPPQTSEGPQIREPLILGKPNGKARASISGYVRNQADGAPLAGARILVPALEIGTFSDEGGYFALNLPVGVHELRFRSYGKAEVIQPLTLRGPATLDIEMKEAVRELDEVLIEAERRSNVEDVQMGKNKVDIQTMKQMPALMGEVDLIRVAIMLPGVQTVGEGAGGFNVRGGAVDQNLVLLQQAPVFNPNHLFGFFSAFNADVVSDFQLYKSGIPARFGGRISSVFDIGLKDGNRRAYQVRGGISPVTSRLSVEGPMLGEKGSFVLGGRTTYSDWLLNLLPQADFRNSRANFFDLNAHLNYEPDPNNRIDVSGYLSQDRFTLNADTTFGYQNANATVSWKHLFNPQLYGVFSGVYSHYTYQVSSVNPLPTAFELGYEINYFEGKADFTWLPVPQHTIRFGLSNIWHQLSPGNIRPLGGESVVANLTVQREQALENALYLSDEWTLNERFTVNAGLRFSLFSAFGPRALNVYGENAPRETGSVIDTTFFGGKEVLERYAGPEVRLAMRYNLDENSSVKLSFNRMRQYLHRVSNTVAIAPTDSWKLSDPYIPPQIGDQLSVGYFRNFFHNSLEASVELYYKSIQNLIDYKPGADLLLNPNIETELLSGQGKAYGIEVLLRKQSGRFNGWISYTYARTFVKVDGEFLEEKVNGGAWFPANFDKPHDITTALNFRFSRRLSLSSNFTYSTGRPITLPVAQYQYGNSTRVFFSDRNAFRVPDYIRWDVSLNVEGSHKIKKLAHSSLSISFYNVLGRQNPYSIYFITENGTVQGYQLSIFGQIIPTVTYNFRI